MSTVHYCEWTPPIASPERFAEWSRDVQRLLDALPQYVASGRKQRRTVLKKEEFQKGQITEVNPWELEEYDEQRHGEKSQYLFFVFSEAGADSIPIRGPDGTGEPIITDTLVAFNAEYREEDKNMGFLPFSPFWLSREELLEGTWPDHTGFLYWSTPWEPHDLLVMAALIRLVFHFNEIHITSDVGLTHWWESIALCKDLFGVAEMPFLG